MLSPDERRALLGGPGGDDEKVENHSRRRPRRLLFTGAALFLAALVAGVGFTSYHIGFENGEKEELEHISGVKNFLMADRNIAQIYKRTHFSTDAVGDAAFLQTYLGLTSTLNNFTNGTDGALCAARESMQGLTFLFLHYTTDYDFVEGDKGTAAWVDAWTGLHGDLTSLAASNGGWDQFMHMSTAFYAPDLTLHVTKLKAGGKGFLPFSYTNPADGSTMWAVMVTVPTSGTMLEVHSGVLAEEYQGDFSSLADAAATSCPEALYASQSVDELNRQWDLQDGSLENAFGLPDLLPIRFSQPVGSSDAYAEYGFFFDEWASLGGSYEAETSAVSPSCTFSSSRKDLFQSSNAAVDLRFVYNPNATDGASGYTVNDFKEYVHDMHYANMGENSGWDKFIDMHIAFHINRTDEFFLDDIAGILEQQGLPYHAHANDDDGSGSIWTGLSLGGMGVEIAGLFDFTRFTQNEVSFLDFCHASSSYDHLGYMHFGRKK